MFYIPLVAVGIIYIILIGATIYELIKRRSKNNITRVD